MDVLYVSLTSEEDATDTARKLREVLASGGFNLTKWSSNSRNFLAGLSPELRATGANPDDKLTLQRVLGLPWYPEKDTYLIQPESYRKAKDIRIPNQRNLLKFTSSIFDPLGITAPLIIRLRCFMQLAWSTGQQWDKPIPDDQLAEFQQWTEEIDHLENIQLPRQLHNYRSQPEHHELHVFSDAYEKAVAYLRTTHDDSHVSITFLFGKARVAPMKRLTIPNLELQAATLGTRLATYIKEELDLHIARTFMWTDSTTVLHWINAFSQRHRIFVANRLNITLDSTESSDWRYVPTIENPADDRTRRYQANQMNATSRWIQGPSFLQKKEQFWPTQLPISQQVAMSHADAPPDCSTSPPFDITRFSNWNRLIRTVAFCFLVADKAKNSQASLTLEHVTKALKFLIKNAQQQSFSKEKNELLQKKSLSNKSSIVQLSPFIDDHGFLRSRGRLGKASIILCSRYPVILDAENPSIDLYLKHVHDTNGHCGLEFSRALIQQQFWILRARKVLRRIIRHCITCRRQQQGVIQPIMADLPKERLPSTINYPFRTTGIDYMGPFFIKTPRAEKRYVLFFTCLVTRAVHIEVTAKLNTDDTILAIRRFICRRGQPQSIRSDNATTFVSANKDLKAALKKLELASPEISARLGLQHIAWNFNPPAAPHFGGAWERLIRSFKDTFYNIVGSRTLQEPTLHTFACEVKAIMNNRPLLHVSSDVTDMEPLTPNHILLGEPQPVVPIGIFDQDADAYTWKKAQVLADNFWFRFIKDYLPTLQRRTKWTKNSEDLNPGDFVWILEDFTARGIWPVGRVKSVTRGTDNVARSCDLATSFGNIKRPAVKLSKLFICDRD